LALVVFWIPAAWGSWNGPRRNRLALAVVMSLLIPMLAPFVGSTLMGTPVFHLRAASIVLPAFVCLAGIGFVTLPGRAAGVMAVCSLILIGTSLGGFLRTPLKDDWRSVTPQLVAQLESDEPLVFDTEIEIRSFKYYAQRENYRPTEMFGLVDAPTSDQGLRGVKWVDGRQVDPQAVDCTQGITTQDSFWLITCNPYADVSTYTDYFRQFGFEPQSRLQSYQIQMQHFVRRDVATAPSVTMLGKRSHDPITGFGHDR